MVTGTGPGESGAFGRIPRRQAEQVSLTETR